MFYSQMRQDEAVNYLLDKDGGYFLDIGAGTNFETNWRPIGYHSNTLFLERRRNWTGICIDLEEYWVETSSHYRNCKLINKDLLKENINDILDGQNCPDVIDYISLDVDAAQSKVFNDFNFDKYKFKVMTIEHNLYMSKSEDSDLARECQMYRDKLHEQGYLMLCKDVILDGHGPVEDWWVDEETFNKHSNLVGSSINCRDIKI